MKNKIVRIFVCLIVLFSIFPTVIGTNHNKIIERSLLKGNNANNIFEGYYGSVVWGLIKLVKNTNTSYWLIPICVRVREFWCDLDGGFSNNAYTVSHTEVVQILKNAYKLGFFTNFTMFYWDFRWLPY